jgi:hypothetical protein
VARFLLLRVQHNRDSAWENLFGTDWVKTGAKKRKRSARCPWRAARIGQLALLDRHPKVLSIAAMKSGVLLLLLLGFYLQPTLAQTGAVESSTERARANALYYDQLVPLDQVSQNEIVTKNMKITGPLTQPLKSKKISEVPRKFFHLINPFAKSAPKAAAERAGDLTPVAWSTAVGWNSGGARFQSEANHESQMGLISFSRAKKP